MNLALILSAASEQLSAQIRREVATILVGETNDGIIVKKVTTVVEEELNKLFDSEVFNHNVAAAVETELEKSVDVRIESVINSTLADYPAPDEIISKNDYNMESFLTKDDIDPSEIPSQEHIGELEARIEALEKVIDSFGALVSNPAVKAFLKAFGVAEEAITAIEEAADCCG